MKHYTVEGAHITQNEIDKAIQEGKTIEVLVLGEYWAPVVMIENIDINNWNFRVLED